MDLLCLGRCIVVQCIMYHMLYMQPAPLSETVDHTLEEGEYTPSQHQAFQPPSPSHSPITSDEEEGEGEESGDEEVLKTIDIGELGISSHCNLPCII